MAHEQHEVRNINVFLRVRPMNERDRENRSREAVVVSSNREVVVKQDNRMTKKFTFDRSFGQDSNQVAVYQSVVAPHIEEMLAGYNCSVFAYGQTGTGKTHTLIGEESPDAMNSWDAMSQAGIIPRAVAQLFDKLRSMGVESSIRISFLEVYDEELTDLLSTADQTLIQIYDHPSKKGSIIVKGLEEFPVHSSADVYKLLAKGQEKRKTASSLINKQSSRSHTIFSILVHIGENNSDGEEVLKVGKLNLVDLAGSENIGKASNEKGIRVRETRTINRSLLTLGRVITALARRAPHIPYRESKLTRLLQESLGGRTKTSIIATVSPGHRDLEETLSTLEYVGALRAKNIENKPEVNEKLTRKVALNEYSEEMKRLKRDLLEKHLTIKVLKDEVAKLQKAFNEVNLNLVQRETKLAETIDTLHSTKEELVHTSEVLRNTNRRYQDINISDMTSDVLNFHEGIVNQWMNGFELIETSMTRNSDQLALILGKLAEQRSAAELNTYEALLSSLDVHIEMLDMVNVQQDLLTNFSTNLVTRLETLSANSSQDLRSNTDSMETISPTITQSMDTLTSVVQTQIAETTNMDGEHAKRSDEHTMGSIYNQTKTFAEAMKSSKEKIINQKRMAAAAAALAKISDGIAKMNSSTQTDATIDQPSRLQVSLPKYRSNSPGKPEITVKKPPPSHYPPPGKVYAYCTKLNSNLNLFLPVNNETLQNHSANGDSYTCTAKAKKGGRMCRSKLTVEASVKEDEWAVATIDGAHICNYTPDLDYKRFFFFENERK